MSWWRKVLNLPEKETPGGDELSEALFRKTKQATGESLQDSPERPPEPAPVWAEEDEGSGKVIARRTGLGAIWLVIGLLAVAGVKATFWPSQQPVPQPRANPEQQAQKDDVPDAAAQQVGARFARSYLTWSEDAPKTREKELERDLPKGADTKAGWNGEGNELVAQTIPGQVTQTRAHQARVSVDARVSTTSGSGKKARTTSSWRALQVPVAERDGRILVTGQPALVGLDRPGKWEEPGDPDADTKLTASTRGTVEDFLRAWAAGTQEQASAPGAKIAPLGAGMKLRSLDNWTVETGSGAHRAGIASVRWQIAGADLQQSYRLTLAQVSASTASRWQVWRVTSQ